MYFYAKAWQMFIEACCGLLTYYLFNFLHSNQQLAQKESTCPSGKSGGSLGTFSPGQMVPAFDKVIFGAEAGAVGAVLGPVETQFGCHLILIISRDDGEKKDGEKDGEKKD